MREPRPRRPLLPAAVVLALAAALTLAGAASAASLRTAKRCYRSGAPIALAGKGFAASAPVTIQRGRRTVSATTDAGGVFTAALRAPTLNPRRAVVRRFAITASDGTTSVRRRLRVTTFAATAKPNARRPSDVVTWRVTGFPPRARVWAHYVHRGRQVERRRFGRMPRPCGVLRKRIRQLPIAAPAAGRWRIQLDTKRRYRAATRFKLVVTGRVRRVVG